MKLIIPYALFTCFIAALYLAVKQYRKEGLKYIENRLFSLLCFFSALWSFGFWCVNIQTEPDNAYFFRAIGMIGVFAYLILMQLLVCCLSGNMKSYYLQITAISIVGFIIYFFIIQKEQATYELSEIGMTYRFTPGFWNNAYIIYTIAIAINLFVSIIYMRVNATNKRTRVLANKLLLVEVIEVLGMMLDTIFPLIGISALPGSTIGQFLALIATYQAIRFINRFRITVDNMSTYVYYSLTTPVLVYDDNYKLKILNDVAYDFTGLTEDKMGDKNISLLFSVREDEVFKFDGKRKDIDAVCYYNRLNCNLSVSKIHDDYYDVIGYIITVTDLSERMESINKLEQAMKDAENANQAKTVFLANMSHEIRTPMNAIIGFAELAMKKTVGGEVRKYIENIHLASHNLLAIINDILDITKIESGKMEVISDNYFIADLLDDVSLIISQQAKKKGLEFVMKTDDDIPTQLFGDKVHLRGVLINILNNAVKYTKVGTVTFETKVLMKTDDYVRLAFVVSDTGIGIREEDKQNLFKSFKRLEHKVNNGIEGSGLGLTIANGYVTMMGGEITVSSVYGEGSVFTVNIEQKIIDDTPLQYQFTIDRVNQKTEEHVQITINDTEVLLVDDNHINLMVAEGLLNSYGLIVDTASDGASAIEMCRNKHYKIVFMDQMMPEIDGVEAMLRIRELDPYYAIGGEGKIIVLTADAIRGVREKLLQKGFDEYLGKPINLRRLEYLLTYYIPSDKITISADSEDMDSEYENEDADYENQEIDYLQNELPEIDVLLGLKNCGGEVSDYLEVLKINYKYGEKNVEELKSLLDKKDYQNYTIKVHAMKSTTKGIGAMEVSDMALKQEEAGRAGEYGYIDEHYEEFKDAYKVQLQKIEGVLKHYNMLEEAAPDDKPELEKDEISNILSNILRYVKNFEFAQVFEILDDVKKYRLPDRYRDIFDKFENMMDDLNVDDIRELIETELNEE